MAEGESQINVQTVVEDVLQQHGKEFCEEAVGKNYVAAMRRDEAARWLRKMVGVVLGRDLPAQPSEEDFRLGLRSGIILCSALNKIHPGAVPKVQKVEVISDGVSFPNVAPVTSSQQSENVRNFLAAIEEMDIPTFEPFDLEKGGDTSRVVDCVLALKSYYEWKRGGGNGQWRFEGVSESPVHRGSDLFLGFMGRSPSAIIESLSEDNSFGGQGFNDAGIAPSLHKLICEILADKNREDIPVVVEHMLSKVMEEFERRLVALNVQVPAPSQYRDFPSFDYSGPRTPGPRTPPGLRTPPGPRTPSGTPPASRTRPVTTLETVITATSDDKVRSPLQDGDVPSFSFSTPMETETQAASQPEKGSSSPKIEKVSSSPKIEKVSSPPKIEIVSSSPKIEKVSSPPKIEIVSSPPTIEKVSSPPKIEIVSSPPSIEKVSSPPEIENVSSPPEIENVSSPPKIEKASSPPNIEQQEVRTPSQEENVSSTPNTERAMPSCQCGMVVQPEPVTIPEPIIQIQYVEVEVVVESKAHLAKCQAAVAIQQRSLQELKNKFYSTKEEVKMMQVKYQEQVEDLGKSLSVLANAANGYKKVMVENRKLYNQIQDLKGNIRVYLRVRPFLPGQESGTSAVDCIEERTITLLCPSKNAKPKKTSFTFNRVFGSTSSQEEVFVDTQPLIRSVLDGYNVCIFAYGQTGSGKTFTMTGPKVLTKETLGVNYRALNDLFLISEDRKDTIAYEISVQMMEIYNEQVRDLLITDGSNKKLEIRNNTANGINVPNANLVRVTSPDDVINLMNLGHSNRAVGSTNMNDRSSRSHSCLTVHVQGTDLTSGSVIRGCLHLVDLAGSERADKTDAVGERLKEANYINKSLSALGDVIASLSQKQSHVPYRNSKLTQLLQDALGGQAKTLMFVHMAPEPDALGETLSTLKFAERVSSVELGAAKTNKDTGDVKELKEQIAALKAALARKDGDETGSLQHSVCSSPDTWAVKSYTNQTEEASNSSRRHSFDSQDCPNSPSWRPDVMNDSMVDLDDQDTVSDSSEVDPQQQNSMNRSNSSSSMDSKNRKPAPKMAAKTQEKSAATAPAKKAAPSTASSAPAKTSRQTAPAAAAAAKRKPAVKGK